MACSNSYGIRLWVGILLVLVILNVTIVCLMSEKTLYRLHLRRTYFNGLRKCFSIWILTANKRNGNIIVTKWRIFVEEICNKMLDTQFFIINLTVPHNNTRHLHRMNSIIRDNFCIQASCNQMENINWIKKVVLKCRQLYSQDVTSHGHTNGICAVRIYVLAILTHWPIGHLNES